MENNLIIHNRIEINNNFRKNNIHIVFLIYWTILVLYESINSKVSRSGIDVVVKVALIGMLTIYCILKADRVSKKIILWLIFTLSLIISFLLDNHFYIDNIISYVYPILFIFLTLILGETNKINQKQFMFFLHWIIIFVTCMAIYALIFESKKIISAFSITTAYGNQLTSFIPSSHECALYFVAGITSSLICIHYSKNKLRYIFAIILFTPLLILTYARTFILGMICIILVYIFCVVNKKTRVYFILSCVIALLLILFIPVLRNFIFDTVFKGNNSAGRDTLYSTAIEYFKNGNILETIWGHGFFTSRNDLTIITGHPKAHNAYLQVLIDYGVVGELFLIIFIIFQIYNCVKIIKKNRYLGFMFFAILMMSVVSMLFDTTYIFDSQCSSFFLTFYSIVIPKYVINSIKANEF